MSRIATNILFTAAGRRVSLVRLFRRAMRTLGDDGRLVTADVTMAAPAHYVGDEPVQVPRCTEAGYIPRLLEICGARRIALLVPLIDPELIVLAPHRDAFAAIGTRLVLSDAETIAIGDDKVRTGAFFQSIGIAAPRHYDAAEIAGLDEARLPLFVKPRAGSSSIGATRIDTLAQLRFHLADRADLIVQDYVTGSEITVDVYADAGSVPRCAVPRRRLAVRAGEVSKALTVNDAEIIAQSLEIVRRLPGAKGCITLQCFKGADGGLTFIEINPRFGGGYPLSAHAGADFPLWLLQEARGETPDYARGQAFTDRLCMLRYDDEIIIDGTAL